MILLLQDKYIGVQNRYYTTGGQRAQRNDFFIWRVEDSGKRRRYRQIKNLCHFGKWYNPSQSYYGDDHSVPEGIEFMIQSPSPLRARGSPSGA